MGSLRKTAIGTAGTNFLKSWWVLKTQKWTGISLKKQYCLADREENERKTDRAQYTYFSFCTIIAQWNPGLLAHQRLILCNCPQQLCHIWFSERIYGSSMKNGAWDSKPFHIWISPEIKTGCITDFLPFLGKLPHSNLALFFYLAVSLILYRIVTLDNSSLGPKETKATVRETSALSQVLSVYPAVPGMPKSRHTNSQSRELAPCNPDTE